MGTEDSSRKRFLDQFGRQMIAGGGAGAISTQRTLTAPMERVKTLLQVQVVSKVPIEQQYKGIVDCLVRIPREQGFLAYWRGNGVNVARMIPNSAIKFTTFTHYKKLAFPEGEGSYQGSEKFFRKMACGGLSGVSTIIPVYPLDLARTRLSADTQKKYKGVFHLIQTTVNVEGGRGLYKGLGISLCGIVPYLAVSLSTYDALKDATKDKPHWQHPIGKVLLGSFAAIISQSITYPIDTIRRHMQVSGALGQKKLYNGTIDCILKIYSTHGVRGFYRGLLANASRAAPQTGIEFAAFDVIISLISQNYNNKAIQRAKSRRKPESEIEDSTQAVTHREMDDSAANVLLRRLSSTLPLQEENRINRVFAALIEKSAKSQNHTIPQEELRLALMELGYEDFEIDEVIGPAAEVNMIGFMEFRRMCEDTKILHLLEQQFDDM